MLPRPRASQAQAQAEGHCGDPTGRRTRCAPAGGPGADLQPAAGEPAADSHRSGDGRTPACARGHECTARDHGLASVAVEAGPCCANVVAGLHQPEDGGPLLNEPTVSAAAATQPVPSSGPSQVPVPAGTVIERVRFGPGVPSVTALAAAAVEPEAPKPSRRRSARILSAALTAAIVAFVVWFLWPAGPLRAHQLSVHANSEVVSCGRTAGLVGNRDDQRQSRHVALSVGAWRRPALGCAAANDVPWPTFGQPPVELEIRGSRHVQRGGDHPSASAHAASRYRSLYVPLRRLTEADFYKGAKCSSVLLCDSSCWH